MNRRASLFILCSIIILQITFSLIRVFQVPMWTGYHHEIDTYRVVHMTMENRRLPIESDFLPGQYAVRQGSQPPLYTILALPLVAAYDDSMALDLPANPSPYCFASDDNLINYTQDHRYNFPYSGTVTAAYALRLLSTLFVTTSVVLTYFAGRAFFPQRPMIGLVAAGILAFEPSHIWLGSTIINDSLLLLIATANLLFAGRVLRAEGIGNPWNIVLLIATALLAILTKLSGWVLFALTILLLTIKVVQILRGHLTRQRILVGVGVLVLPLILGGLVITYNIITVGNPLGRYSNLGAIVWSTLQGFHRFPRTLIAMLAYSAENYISFLRQSHLPGRIVDLYALGTLLALLTIPVAIIKYSWQRHWKEVRAIGWLLLVSLGGIGIVLLRNHAPQIGETFHLNLIYAPLRYYVTMTPALVLVLSLGLYSLLPERFAQWHPTGGAAVTSWLGIAVIVIAMYPQATLLHESVLTQREFINHMQKTNVIEANRANSLLLGYTNPKTTQSGQLEVDLYAGTIAPLDQNLMGQLKLVDANGTEIECQFLPVRGLYPTTRWQPGEIVKHTQTINNCTQPLQEPIQVQFQWVNGDIEQPAQPLTILNKDMGISNACPPNKGTIGNELQITSMRLPDALRAGQTLEPYVNYTALSVPFAAETRTFTAVHETTGKTYQCANLLNIDGRTITFGESRAGTARGETIFMDSCAMYIPTDAPLGTYHVYVQFADAQHNPLSTVNASGETTPDNKLEVGTVQIK